MGAPEDSAWLFLRFPLHTVTKASESLLQNPTLMSMWLKTLHVMNANVSGDFIQHFLYHT